MIRVRIIVLFCVVAATLDKPVVSSQTNVRLLLPGTFMIDAPQLQASEQWFGVRQRGKAWDVIRVVPRITPGEPVCTRTTRIAVDADVRFLISGVQKASPGPIITTIESPRFLHPGERVNVSVRRVENDGYSLEALGTASREEGGVIFLNYALWVRRGQIFQSLATFERSTERRRVLWSGDLDRDLRPDFLFDLPSGDVGAIYVLFLSSAAVEDELVGRVATFLTPGC